MRERLLTSVLAACVLAGCAADTDLGGPMPDQDEPTEVGSSSAALSAQSFAFFAVTRDRRGAFSVAPVNRTRVRCAGGALADRCGGVRLDLEALGMTATEERELLGDVGTDARAPQLLFLGSVARPRRWAALELRVVEVWRAASPVRLDGTLFHVSTSGADKAQAAAPVGLRLNAWRKVRIGSVDLDRAPGMEPCVFVPRSAEPCETPHDPARGAMASDAGLVVAGRIDAAGRLAATQYFLKVNVGVACADGGFNVCGEGPKRCDLVAFECRTPPRPGVVTIVGRGRLGKVAYDRSYELAPWLDVLQRLPDPGFVVRP